MRCDSGDRRLPHIVLRLCVLALTMFVIFSAELCHADMVRVASTARADVDSLDRFLVIRDSEPLYFFGERILPLGDMSGDGHVDILVWKRVGNILATNPAFVYYGGPTADSIWELRLDSIRGTVGVLGDVNADGYDDLGYHRYPEGFRITLGGPGLNDSTDFLIPNILPGNLADANGAIDLLGDGALFLPLASNANGGPVYIYRIDHLRDTIPEFVIPDTGGDFGKTIVTGEFSGDQYPDIAISSWPNSDTNFIKFFFGGPDFDTISDFTLYGTDPRFGQTMVPLGDFNADGQPDLLVVGQSSPYVQGIYFLGDSLDGQVDMITSKDFWGYYGATDAALIGDFNADGYPDFVTSETLTPNVYQNVLRIYLGGPRSDSVISPDIVMDGVDIPGGQVFLGWEVRGIGDFSGDGIDDFAAMSTTASGGPDWYGEVNLFAGYDTGNATDVDYDYEPTQPSEFLLDQNYPNPFNAETTIEFDLPRTSVVELSITNILGQKVRTLIDRRLPPGHYRLPWDGTDGDGDTVASGVYFYRLDAGDYSRSRKMVLLK